MFSLLDKKEQIKTPTKMIFPWFNSICIWSLLIASFLLSESITWLVTGFPHPVDHTGSPQDNQTLTSISIISTCMHISKFLLICKPFLNQVYKINPYKPTHPHKLNVLTVAYNDLGTSTLVCFGADTAGAVLVLGTWPLFAFG